MSYAETLDRIPDDIVLSASTREFEMAEPSRCICGWVLCEALARAAGVAAEDVPRQFNVDNQCHARFGGELFDWRDIFLGVTQSSRLPEIETAWVDRLNKAVRRSR